MTVSHTCDHCPATQQPLVELTQQQLEAENNSTRACRGEGALAPSCRVPHGHDQTRGDFLMSFSTCDTAIGPKAHLRRGMVSTNSPFQKKSKKQKRRDTRPRVVKDPGPRGLQCTEICLSLEPVDPAT